MTFFTKKRKLTKNWGRQKEAKSLELTKKSTAKAYKEIAEGKRTQAYERYLHEKRMQKMQEALYGEKLANEYRRKKKYG